MASDKDFVVAIELGSSRISGIAGRKKDGTMQVLAYAEENTTACVKRGVVWNIEKTYQSINTIISKLEAALKAKISRAYVGVAGQSVRSYKCIIKRNLGTHSYITQELVNSLRQESYDIPYQEYTVLENIPQDYVIDSNGVTEPVGVMGTNIEGEYIDIIANQKILQNINTVFGNTNVKIADVLISSSELGNHILTDAEKRSGCALVDLGADTTTVVIYKTNIVRYLVTIPLGINNINKDLASINITDDEAEDVKIKFADAIPERGEDGDSLTYTTSDGRIIDISKIQTIIEARISEIIANINAQIVASNYGDKLLAGLVLTGGGSLIKNIEQAIVNATNVDKIRTATTLVPPFIKASGMGNPTFETVRGLNILSLLMSGKESCAAVAVQPQPQQPQSPDLFEQMKAEEERVRRQKEKEAQEKADAEMATNFENMKSRIRQEIAKVQQAIEDVKNYGSDKKVRERCMALSDTATTVITEEFEKHVDILSSKEKYKEVATDGQKLSAELRRLNSDLRDLVMKAKDANKFWNKVGKMISDIVNE